MLNKNLYLYYDELFEIELFLTFKLCIKQKNIFIKRIVLNFYQNDLI